MASTLGSLIDQLTILNLKLWHREEVRHPESGLPANDRLRASDEICILNKQRHAIIEEIDDYFSGALKDPSKARKFPQMKDYKAHAKK